MFLDFMGLMDDLDDDPESRMDTALSTGNTALIVLLCSWGVPLPEDSLCTPLRNTHSHTLRFLVEECGVIPTQADFRIVAHILEDPATNVDPVKMMECVEVLLTWKTRHQAWLMNQSIHPGPSVAVTEIDECVDEEFELDGAICVMCGLAPVTIGFLHPTDHPGSKVIHSCVCDDCAVLASDLCPQCNRQSLSVVHVFRCCL